MGEPYEELVQPRERAFGKVVGVVVDGDLDRVGGDALPLALVPSEACVLESRPAAASAEHLVVLVDEVEVTPKDVDDGRGQHSHQVSGTHLGEDLGHGVGVDVEVMDVPKHTGDLVVHRSGGGNSAILPDAGVQRVVGGDSALGDEHKDTAHGLRQDGARDVESSA